VGFTAFTALIFSFLRPYNTVVYAPKLKHADEKRAPPPIGKGFFAWTSPLWNTSEKELVGYAGMDAAIFIRFTKMCRNIFLTIAVLGSAVLLPIYWTKNQRSADPESEDDKWFIRLTLVNVHGEPLWALVVLGYIFNIVICGFLWWNYRQVLQLRRIYFESDEYQHSLSARTLMVS
jgi:calcium permeable stress-gated cation channel